MHHAFRFAAFASSIALGSFLAACGTAAPAAEQSGTNAAATYTIAGLRPGMTVDEAIRTLEADGFTVETRPGRSYENAIADALIERDGMNTGLQSDGGGVYSLKARKGGETVSAIFIRPSAGRGTIEDLVYSTQLTRVSRTALREQVIQRYGQPTVRWNEHAMGWCTAGDTCQPQTTRGQMLMYDDGSDVIATLSLTAGQDLKERLDEAFAEDVARRAGRAKPSF